MTEYAVTVQMTLDVRVEVTADKPSDAVTRALADVDERGWDAGSIEWTSRHLHCVQTVPEYADGALDADVDNDLDVFGPRDANGHMVRKWSTRSVLKDGPTARDLSWPDLLALLDEWVEDHPLGVSGD